MLSGEARVAGVIGWPVGHSRSPRLHGFWLDRYRIDGAYVPLAVKPEHFSVTIRGLVAAGFAGVNVTIPHKEAAFAVCDAVGESARKAGAVNTLVFRDGRIDGANSDISGFLENLHAHNVDPKAGPALILGAGGAARAIVVALQQEGVPLTIANRARDRAEALARDFSGLKVIDWSARDQAIADYALIVNTTALGMEGQPDLSLDLSLASNRAAVADLVYVPLETPLLAAARARGLRTVEGLGMLLHQARPGFAAWFGVEPEVDEALYRFVAADLLRSEP
ncbi:MAG: shikimate dehydrogenase [Acetobacteraceae bacterium]|nr:shikimate dehydrogenase [Acetobacteraceae bacterium]